MIGPRGREKKIFVPTNVLIYINNDSGTARQASKKKKSRVQCKNRIIVIIIRGLPLKSIGCNMGERGGGRLRAAGRTPLPPERG